MLTKTPAKQQVKKRHLVSVKTKSQITLPSAIRRQAKVEVGDVFEVCFNGKDILLKPAAVVTQDFIDAAIAEGLADIQAGRVSPAFPDMADMRAHLLSDQA